MFDKKILERIDKLERNLQKMPSTNDLLFSFKQLGRVGPITHTFIDLQAPSGTAPRVVQEYIDFRTINISYPSGASL